MKINKLVYKSLKNALLLNYQNSAYNKIEKIVPHSKLLLNKFSYIKKNTIKKKIL